MARPRKETTTATTAESGVMTINYKKLSPEAIEPKMAHMGEDAAFDLYAARMWKNGNYQIVYSTDIAFEIPKGYAGFVYPRSSIRDYDLQMVNSVGVIDSGYRGGVQVTFTLTAGAFSNIYNVGDRIAQIVFMPIPNVELKEAESLSESERGEGGHGSSGVE